MAEEVEKVQKEIQKLRKEKSLLEGLKTYYSRDVTFQELEELTGFNMREITGYMEAHYYPRKSLGESIDKNRELAAIQKRFTEIDEEILNVKSQLVKELTSILLIPSWSELINAKFKGVYAGKAVSSLKKDAIIMLTDLRAGFSEITGEELVLITGPGIYFTEFTIETRMLVRDHRELSAILLPKSVVDRMWDAPSIFRGENMNITLNELVATIPFDIILRTTSEQTFLRGILARNIFLPYREIFDLLYETCSSINSYPPEEGLKCLSASPLWFNRLLVQGNFTSSPRYSSYMQLTAGLSNIQPVLDRFLSDIFEEDDISQLFERITTLKQNYTEIGKIILQEWIPD